MNEQMTEQRRNRETELLRRQETARQLLFGAVRDKAQVQMQVDEISIDHIDMNPTQPRKYIDPVKMAELEQSIASQGLLQPVVVTPRPNGRWMLVAGERRFRACRNLGYRFIPCRKIYDIDETKALEIALIENLARDDLSPIEEARTYRQLIDQHGYTQEKFAALLGRSQDTISDMLGLLTLAEEVQEMLTTRVVSYGQARDLRTISEPELQVVAAREIRDKRMTSRQSEAFIRQFRQEHGLKPPKRGGAARQHTTTVRPQPVDEPVLLESPAFPLRELAIARLIKQQQRSGNVATLETIEAALREDLTMITQLRQPPSERRSPRKK